jgi:uncharacterized membrane protein
VTRSDRKRIDDALRAADAGTSSLIAVRVIPDDSVDAFEHAKTEFLARGLHTHHTSGAALILVAPKSRTFAVIGDRALHERVGQKFWDDLVTEMSTVFKTDTIANAIVKGIDRLGEALREHFPAEKAP